MQLWLQNWSYKLHRYRINSNYEVLCVLVTPIRIYTIHLVSSRTPGLQPKQVPLTSKSPPLRHAKDADQVPDRPQRCRPRGAPLPSRPSADRKAVFVLPTGSRCWLMINMRIRLPKNRSLRRLYFKRLLAQVGLRAQA
jgi:hypothetical protein